jgi:MutS domain V
VDPKRDYSERLNSLQTSLEASDRRGAQIANGRTITFLGALGVFVATVFQKLPPIAHAGAAGLLLGFIALAVWHGNVIAAENRLKVKLALNQRGIGRLAGTWRGFASRGERWLSATHLYAADLDIFGQGSLFQRLDETGTLKGEERLADWLLRPAANATELAQRQSAVAELAPRIDFRQELVTEARVAQSKKPDPSKFVAWAEGGSGLESIRWAWGVAHVLPPVTLFFVFAAEPLLLPLWLPAIGVGLQLVVVALTRKALAAAFEKMDQGEDGFARFEATFSAIAGQKFEGELLKSLQAGGAEAAGPSVPERLKGFSRLWGFASLRKSGQYHALINLLTLWDVHVLFRLERWRAQHAKNARHWFESLYTLEGLSALATFAYENPKFPFPSVRDGAFAFEATQLGHPLLDEPVCNDVRLEGPGRLLIVTGSNMSGKTTLLRAMGINTVLALAGAPVCAQALTVSRLQVVTGMRVKDSLERGVSYFYAEAQRMKALFDAAKANPRGCLFLLDEVLMGTNARERQIASRGLLELLLGTGASGAIATHDLAVAELAAEPKFGARNVHFSDFEQGGAMTFSYRLEDGVVKSTNALKVLAAAGLPISE